MSRYKKSEWNGKYQRILIYAEKGASVDEIAKKEGMHPGSVYRIMNDPRFQTRRSVLEEKLGEKARAVFEAHAIQAAKKIVTIAKTGKSEDRIKFDAAKEVLYQVGVKPVEVIETRKREYSPEEVLSALAAVREIEAITNRVNDGGSKFILPDETKKEVLSGSDEQTK